MRRLGAALLAPALLAGCAAGAETCRTRLSEQAPERIGSLSITVAAPDTYCVDPQRRTAQGGVPGEARLTNTGQVRVTIRHAGAGAAVPPFRAVRLAEPGGAAPPLFIPDPAPASRPEAEIVLDPGQTAVLRSWSRYHDVLEQVVAGQLGLDQERLAGRPAGPRRFLVRYRLILAVEGEAPVDRIFELPLLAIRQAPG